MTKDPTFAGAGGECAEVLRVHPPRTAVVLGSGLGEVADRIVGAAPNLPAIGGGGPRVYHCHEILGMPRSTVEGHDGRVVLGRWGNRPVAVFCGRLHAYEGHDPAQRLIPIRMAIQWGIRELIVTNAAGGIREDLAPGRFMALTAHLRFRLPGPSDGCGGSPTRNRPMYRPELRARLATAAAELSEPVAEGVYASVLGPNYETPAEIRALQALGCDAVGMSTADEIEYAAEQGVACCAISCIANRAAGLNAHPLTHAEVLENTRKQANRLGNLLERLLQRLD